MSDEKIIAAAAKVSADQGRWGCLDARFKLAMCDLLNCSPSELDSALDADDDLLIACLG